MYDVIMSLGYNCEISFRLENFLGKIEAMPFSWSYVLDRDKFPALIKDIKPLFAGELSLQEDNMIKCENTQIKFHPRYDILLENGEISEESFGQAVKELQSRVEHLKVKFADALDSNKSILFFMKVENKGTENNLSYMKSVIRVLEARCSESKYMLVFVMEKDTVTEEVISLERDNVKVRGLKKFAPRKHTDTMGDVRGWYKLLREFTGDSGKGYYRRLNRKRVKWFCAVMKKKLFK